MGRTRWNGTSRHGAGTLACAVVCALGMAGGAGGASAQRLVVTEAAAGGTAVFARRAFWGGELAVARRPGGQGRLALTAAGGVYGGGLGMRVETSAQLLLKPSARAGTSAYGGLGLAFVGGRTERGAGYLSVLLGFESAPGRAAGWYLELGVAGGLRLSAGRRWRRLPAGWK